MTEITAHHQKLHVLAGVWSGEEMVYPQGSDRGGRASSRVEAKIALGGLFVIADYVEERAGAAEYRGHGVYGYDALHKSYSMHWFDSMGSVPSTVTRGKWEGARLVFEHRTHEGYARYTYELDGDGAAYKFRIENSRDCQEWTPFMEGKYRRIG
jgi:hypothetical protein